MPKIRNRGAILALLTLVYAFNFIDRQIVGVLAPFIKADLALSDTQIGLLSGAVFAIFYTFLGIPIASLVDNTRTLRIGGFALRFDRTTIIALSLATWSVFTLLTGLAGGFVALALLRVGVAVGEAGGSPPSHALLSDLYPPNERARALGIYALGIPFGIMVAYFAGAFFVSGGQVDWRAAFIVVGALGLPLALAIKVLLPEPERGRTDGPVVPVLPFGQAVGKLLAIPSYWTMALGIAFASFGSYAVSAFLVVYIRQAFPEIPLVPLYIGLGIGNATFYAGGTFLGGVVADRFGRSNVGAYAASPAIATAIAACVLAMAWLTGSALVHFVGIAAFVFFSGSYLGPSFSVAQNLAGISVRATSTAVFFFVLNLIAMGGGPSLVGWLSDVFAAQTGDPLIGLRRALLSLSVTYVVSVVMFTLTAMLLPRDWRRAREADATEVATVRAGAADSSPAS